MPSAERKTDKKPEWAKKPHIFNVSCPCNNMKWISLKCRESSREKNTSKNIIPSHQQKYHFQPYNKTELNCKNSEQLHKNCKLIIFL